MVALRKESVDRNTNFSGGAGQLIKSLSARRAWIEIKSGLQPLIASLVALRKESVDRNAENPMIRVDEITVALRKESVDRNACSKLLVMLILGRSPQGERG